MKINLSRNNSSDKVGSKVACIAHMHKDCIGRALC